MTSQEYKDLATANGYELGDKTDAELLADYAFHKAACQSNELVVWAYGKETRNGVTQAFAIPTTQARSNLNIALDGLDRSFPVEDIWADMLQPCKLWNDVHVDGKLDPSKL